MRIIFIWIVCRRLNAYRPAHAHAALRRGAPSGDRSRDGILQRYGPLRAHRPRHTAGVLPPRGPQSSRPSLPSRSRDHHGEPPRQRVPLARLFPAICNGNRKGLQAPLPNQARPPYHG
eukprot:XP_001708222.1 Hypothetical protein GL50803_19928 [Giardia lamblia ATCC 50803]